MNSILESFFNILAVQVSLIKFTEHLDVGTADY